MTPAELTVIEKKYSAPRVCQMADPEILAKVVDAVKRIHVITGWTIPEDESYIKILAEEFKAKLVEDFPNINFEEITHAFRKNGLGVKDWCKIMNLQMIFEVLDEYMTERRKASEKEERLKNKPVQKIYTLDELEDFQRGHIEAFYQRCLKGVLPPSELPEYFLPILVKDGLISAESNDLHAFFADRINEGYKNIYLKA